MSGYHPRLTAAETDLVHAAKTRSRCVLWLSSQCRSQGCACIAAPLLKQEPPSKPQETTP